MEALQTATGSVLVWPSIIGGDVETTEMLMLLNIYQYFKVGGWPRNMGIYLKRFRREWLYFSQFL